MMYADIPLEFLKRFEHQPTWQDVAYGFVNGLLKPKSVIDFATEVVANTVEPADEVLAIAMASFDDPIADALSRVLKRQQPIADSDLQARWARVLACWAYEHRNQVGDLLGTIETIYSDYGYPAELAPFVRYMPSDMPDLGSTERNEEQMIAMLGEYVARLLRPCTQREAES